MRPAGSPAKAKQAGGLRPAPEGMNRRMPTVDEFDRWYQKARRQALRLARSACIRGLPAGASGTPQREAARTSLGVAPNSRRKVRLKVDGS